MIATNVFSKNLAAYLDPTIRTIVNKGGTRSSKTWSILQLLNYIASMSTRPRTISIVSKTMPHLKKGCMRDFEDILKSDKLWNDNNWSATDKIYKVNNSKIEFFSAESADKVTGPARDILYINECINIPFNVYRELVARTTEKVILDYNPLHKFWVDSKVLPNETSLLIHSTYKDNDMLTPAQVAEIEYQGSIDENYYKIMLLGETGNYEGLVIKNWDIVDRLPKDYKKRWIGLDWGWSSPTAIMLVQLGERDEIYIDEIAYSTGLDNPDIAQIIIEAGLKDVEIIADAAEAKSIKELQSYGLNCVKSDNKDIDLGIQIMNRYVKHYTMRSTNSIDENRKYTYTKDADGNYTNNPIDKFNHAKDAERYVFLNRLSNVNQNFDFSVINTARR